MPRQQRAEKRTLEIGEVLGKSGGTISRNLAKIKKLLREEYEIEARKEIEKESELSKLNS